RPARRGGAPSLAALPDAARGRCPVRRPLSRLAEATPALSDVGPVRAAVRCIPVCGRVRARARCAARLPRLELADHGPGAVVAARRARPVLGLAVTSGADPDAAHRRRSAEGEILMRQYLDLLRHVL